MNQPLDPATEDLLADYVARGLAMLEAGEAVDATVLCAAHPELAPAVADALGLRVALPALHSASNERDRWEGQLVGGRYRLLEQLGRGASGSVYRARDEELRREVAVKVLHSGLLASEQAEQRFLREAVVLAQYEHPHVVRVYDRGRTEQGALWLVMELLHGVGLQDVLAAATAAMPLGASAAAFADTGWLRELLPEAKLERSYLRQIVQWAIELGAGLAAAHQSNVFHRDVKPSNAFIRRDGSAALLDFGIAVRTGDPSMTLHHTVLGTPWYMPPEQARGTAAPAPTLDVYGLCATLYHLITLHPPHEGDLQQVLRAARERDPVPAVRLHPGLPRDLQAILDKGLEGDPERRYPDVAAVLADLRAFLEHRPVSVRPLGPFARTLRRARRRPALTAATFASALALALFGVALPLYHEVRAAEVRKERVDRMAHLPADTSIEGSPDQRLLIQDAERSKVIAELDRILELDPDNADNLPIRLMRASERLDAGQHALARADLDEIAARARSPYLKAVAACYAKADSSKAGTEAVQLADLPAPERLEDFFVAGFHELRNRHVAGYEQRAEALLAKAADYPPAADLHLLALLGCGRWDQARDEANRLEGVYGHPTARTQHTIGAALLGIRHYAEAIPFCEKALELRPDRHGPWNNLGLAHLRLGNVPRARECLTKAAAIRPWFDNTRVNLCQVLSAEEDFAAARREAERIGSAWSREWELGNVDLLDALHAFRLGRRDEVRTLALAAAGHFESAGADRSPDNRKRAGAAAAAQCARTVAAGDAVATLPMLLDALRRDPHNPMEILNLVSVLEDATLTGADLDRLRLFLIELALSLAPDSADLKAARTTLLESLSGKGR